MPVFFKGSEKPVMIFYIFHLYKHIKKHKNKDVTTKTDEKDAAIL